MSDEHLAPMPTPASEDPQLLPGGVDADALHTDPAVDDVLPEEVAEADDKTQEPDGSDDEESGTTESPSAGQEAEDGSPEPPA